MKNILYTIIVVSSLTLISPVRTFAQAGSLDFTFSDDGKVITPIGNASDQGMAVAIQTDGKIVVAGWSNNGGPNNDFAVVRYNTDGTVDNAFGVNGKAVTDFAADDDRAAAIAIQSDGKIVVAGYAFNNNDPDFALVRYNANGTLDNSFDTDGKVITDFAGSDEKANALAIQSDGKIVVAGFSDSGANNDFAVARYNTDGSLDNSFDTDGKVISDFGISEDYGYSVGIQSDGKIVVAGFSSIADASDFAILRYNTDGTLDDAFGIEGMTTTDFGNIYEESYSLVIQTDGKIVSAGIYYNGSNYDFGLARYNSDGSLDDSFDVDGKLNTPVGPGDDLGTSIALQDDGKIVMAGFSFNAGNADLALMRLNMDGSLDNSFNADGITTTDLGNNVEEGNAVAIQSDGKIVLAGTTLGTTYDFAVVRYEGIGTINISENTDPILITAFPSPFTNELIVNGTTEKGTIRILDITGKELLIQSTFKGQTKIDSRFLKPGYYLLNYSEKNKTVNIKLSKF